MNAMSRGLAALLVLLAPAWAGCVAPGIGVAPDAALPALPCPDPCARLVEGPERVLQEAPLAVHPTDPSHRVAVLSEGRPGWGEAGSWFSVAVTRDGGETWTKRPLPGGLDAPPTETLWGVNHLRYPSVVITPEGVVLVSGWALFHGGWTPDVADQPRRVVNPGPSPRNLLFVARSADGGDTFPHVTILQENGGLGAAGASAAYAAATTSWLAVGPDGGVLFAYPTVQRTAYASAADVSVGPRSEGVVARRSQDAGRTWSAPELIEGRVLLQPRAQIAPDGTEYVLLHDRTNAPPQVRNVLPPPYDLVLAVREPGAATWTSTPIGTSGGHGRIAVPPSGEPTLYVVHPEFVGDPEDLRFRTVLKRSDDRGRTWCEPIVVQEPEFGGHPYPTVGVDAQGTVFVTLYHPVEENGWLEHRAYAVQEGRVGPHAVLGRANAHGDTFLFGHYMSVVGLDEGAAVAWLEGTTKDQIDPDNELSFMTATIGSAD